MSDETPSGSTRPPRRPRYRGKHPRHFADKYKEHNPELYPETLVKVIASGKTPAGSHRPIMLAEIMDALRPRAGEIAVDATIGYGGHAQAILERIQPGGRLLGLDVDPIELPRTEARLHSLGHGAALALFRSNFAGLPKVLAKAGLTGADVIVADLGVSSMQLDDPARGFSMKSIGPLDMRMNPTRGQSVADLLRNLDARKLSRILQENADEPHADVLGMALAGKTYETTKSLAAAVTVALPRIRKEDLDQSIRRVFQALRIAVNDEFSALDAFLRQLPACLNAGGRVAFLTFHSGEDRRVKKAFAEGERAGLYSEIASEVIRASPEERLNNPRSTSAKLRWARRSDERSSIS